MARKKLRTIGHRVVRELERKLPDHLQNQYESEFRNYKKALTQERYSKDKIYSLHEPQTACIGKGKAHKAYEFGTKVAVVRGHKTGVITAIKRFSANPHDSITLEESLNQSERVRKYIGGTRPKIADIFFLKVSSLDISISENLIFFLFNNDLAFTQNGQ